MKSLLLSLMLALPFTAHAAAPALLGAAAENVQVVFVSERQGMLRALMPYGGPAADIAHDLRLLLQH